jgi:aspartate/methionine/tyrosine aminotransferase
MRQSDRMHAVQPPIVPIVGRWIRETPGTISLGQGMVAYGPPAEAIASARAFGDDPDQHRYGPVEGESALVAALERKLAGENGIAVSPLSRVVVTAGANMGFLNAVLAIADPGDEVILPAPFYFNHDMAIVIAGCRTVAVPTDARYQLDLDAIERAITPRTRAVVTVSPNNPTGAIYPEAALRELNALCAGRGLFHVHDQAYEYFTYDEARSFSPGAMAGAAAHTISLFSLSKAYGFASWRIGYMVVPGELFDAVNKVQDTNLICPPLVSQYAALGALRAGVAYTRTRLADLAQVRREVFSRLASIGDVCDAPRTDGAFYVFMRVRADLDPVVLAERLVREHRVAVIPGTAFGLTSGCYLRVSYGALAGDTVVEGTDRLVGGIRAVTGA